MEAGFLPELLDKIEHAARLKRKRDYSDLARRLTDMEIRF